MPHHDQLYLKVAQQVAPRSRIVYADDDPLVLVHAEALLTSAPGGVTSYIEADVRDPDAIMRGAARTLDFGRAVAPPSSPASPNLARGPSPAVP